MAVPKQRKTKSRRNQRRMHIHLDKPSLTDCPQCKEKKLTHRVCDSCGFYKGKEIVDVLKKEKSISKSSSVKERDSQKEEKKPLTMESLSKKDKK